MLFGGFSIKGNLKIMKTNYFTIHKNKKPKKSKYSKRYSKQQQQQFNILTEYFTSEIEKIENLKHLIIN